MNKDFFCNNEYRCSYKERDEDRNFHHLALYYVVDLDVTNLKESADGQDSLGAEFIPLSQLSLSNTSPIAYPIIMKIVDVISKK